MTIDCIVEDAGPNDGGVHSLRLKAESDEDMALLASMLNAFRDGKEMRIKAIATVLPGKSKRRKKGTER